jgi:hypothetical protein
MPDNLDDERGLRPGAGDHGERGDTPVLPGETRVGPPGAAPRASGASEQAPAISTIFVPDDPRGGATMFVADENPRPFDGTLLSFPEDDRRPSAKDAASVADGASPQARSTLITVPDERGPSGGTGANVPGHALRRRGVRVAASLALAAAIAALAVVAYSSQHASTRTAPRDAGADGEPLDRAAAGAGVEARARCAHRLDGRNAATATVTCDVSNDGPVWARVRVTAWMHGPGGARRVGAGKALLAPAEHATLHFEGPAPAGARDECDCRVEAVR